MPLSLKFPKWVRTPSECRRAYSATAHCVLIGLQLHFFSSNSVHTHDAIFRNTTPASRPVLSINPSMIKRKTLTSYFSYIKYHRNVFLILCALFLAIFAENSCCPLNLQFCRKSFAEIGLKRFEKNERQVFSWMFLRRNIDQVFKSSIF